MESKEILVYLSMKYDGNWDKIYDAIANKEELEEEEVLKTLEKVKSRYVILTDEEYPESLKQMYKPPFVLYYEGDISLLSDTHNKLAVVGTRDASAYGLNCTKAFVSELAKDFVIVSGLAYGVDAAAHKAAIENGGRTVAVLGNGLNKYYIKENMDLFKKIKEKHLIISEYPDDVEPQPKFFPVRNRIIAGLCDTVLIPEGRKNSGTQVTAHLMARKGGNVCCVPTRINEDSICNDLIADGAYLVQSPQDIYDITRVVSPKPIFES